MQNVIKQQLFDYFFQNWYALIHNYIFFKSNVLFEEFFGRFRTTNNKLPIETQEIVSVIKSVMNIPIFFNVFFLDKRTKNL